MSLAERTLWGRPVGDEDRTRVVTTVACTPWQHVGVAGQTLDEVYLSLIVLTVAATPATIDVPQMQWGELSSDSSSMRGAQVAADDQNHAPVPIQPTELHYPTPRPIGHSWCAHGGRHEA